MDTSPGLDMLGLLSVALSGAEHARFSADTLFSSVADGLSQ